jgi:hypothetical protein
MKAAAQGINELPQVGRDFSLVQIWLDENVEQRLPV